MESLRERLSRDKGLKYLFTIYMGYLNGDLQRKTSKKGEKGDAGVGFELTADEHYHLKGKRLTNVSAPVDNHDANTKKLVTELLKTKSDKIYVDNELAKKASQSTTALAALNNKVKKLEATVGELQKAVLLLERRLKRVSE